MFFLIPTATDAPSYHWPFATIGMIVFNCVVLGLQFAFPEAAEFFILRYQVFNPIAWFSSCCMHAGIIHLLGNMVLLAICGWVIEGKVGWWKFLLIFFAIGVPANIFEQLVMFSFSDGGSLGASGVIYGMLAITMIWAPENNITFTYFGVFFFRPIAGAFSISIMAFCFVMIGIEFLTVWFSFFKMSSALLHLMGVVPGALIGYLTVKLRLVDCEGYDLLSVQSGNAGKRVRTRAQDRENKERRKQLREEAAELEQDGLNRVESYIRDGHFEMAVHKFRMLRRKNSSLVMTELQYVALINGLSSKPKTEPLAIELMKSYLEHYETLKITLVLKLAKYALKHEGRPKKCLEILRQLEGETLGGKQRKQAQAMIQLARREIAEGSLDLSEQ
jgi:membrane associated rhomboid family serine protease